MCSPSACGIIRNISSPFRLKGDTRNCGNRRFELICENNVTFLDLNSHKYYVKSINYTNDGFKIRVADASINNNNICSFPTFSMSAYNFPFNRPFINLYQIPYYDPEPYPINFLSCPNPLKNSSFFTEITQCASSASSSSISQYPSSRHTYIKVCHLNASEVIEQCKVEVIVMTSWEFKDSNNVSLSEIHDALLYGFELSTTCIHCVRLRGWYSPIWVLFLAYLLPIVGLLCAGAGPPVMTIFGFVAISAIIYINMTMLFISIDITEDSSAAIVAVNWMIAVLGCVILAIRIIIFPLALWFLIYKFRRRHFSLYETIECFLRSDNSLAPIRYSYSDLKTMTKSFKDKLGEGGYGCVYKGKLRSGHLVAVKLLGKSGGNGQDFMNEIATIGRIHHVNVVKLDGYCAQGSKRALIYDFMPNGSLDKYLSSREKMVSLNWDTKFEIALGIARGIEYLHRGCDVQILHFDIKPHNILLDDHFVPKVSDFGLAKLCSTDKTAVTMTAA